MHQKPVRDSCLVLVTKNSHSMQEILFKIFWKSIIKKPQKSYFFFQSQSLLMDKIVKNKRSLELVTSRSSYYKISSKKSLH